MKIRFWKILANLLFATGTFQIVCAQMSISGPTCVNPSTQYQYTISGNWGSGTSMTWTVTNGTIVGSSSGTPLPSIHVTWTSGQTIGTVKVSTTNPTSAPTLNVTITSTVSPGSITGNLSQTISYNTIPGTITCSAATGGGCSPSYSYQWQSSTDGVNFSNIWS